MFGPTGYRREHRDDDGIDMTAAYSPRDFLESEIIWRRRTAAFLNRLRGELWKRWDILALVILGIMVRLPRVSGIIGDDAFVVLWMGLALSEGHWEIWTISPVSPFGLHPYSPGAIGGPLLIAIMIRLGFSYEAIVLIISLAAGVIGTLGAYALGGELFGTKQGSFFFSLFYSFSQVFLRFTYYTISLRGPLLALLPWFLLYSIRTIRSRKSVYWSLTRDGLTLAPHLTRRNAFVSALLFLLLILTHGLAIFLILYMAVVIGYYILKRLKDITGSRSHAARHDDGFDSEGIISAEELILCLNARKEILTSYPGLEAFLERVPEMGNALIMAVMEELSTTRQLYGKAFKDEEMNASADGAGIELRKELLGRIDLALNRVQQEAESRSLGGHIKRVADSPGTGVPSDLNGSTSDEPGASHHYLTLRHLRRRLGSKISLSGVASWAMLLLLMGGAYFVGTRVLPVQASKTASFLGLSNSSFFGLSVNLVVDYGLLLGLMSLFFPVGVLGAFHRDRGSDRRIIHCLLLPLVMFTIPMSTYASVLFLPVFGYYSVVGLNVIWSSFKTRWMGGFSLAFVFVFGFSYQLIVVSLPFWILVLIASIVVFSFVAIVDQLRRWYSYQTLVGKTLRTWKSAVGQAPRATLDRLAIPIFLMSVIIISLMTTEGILLQSEDTYLSQDEKRIIEFLDTQTAPGITFVPTPVIGRRLEAYGFPAVLSYNDAAALYFGWANATDVISSCHLSLIAFFRGGNLYVEDDPDRTPERMIYNSLFHADLTNPTIYELAKQIGLEYVVVEKNATGYSNLFHSTYGETPSTLLSSAPLACELVVEGQRMSLFRLP